MVLIEADIARLHATLRAPVTTFDCGRLCAPGNGGEAIPVFTGRGVVAMPTARRRRPPQACS